MNKHTILEVIATVDMYSQLSCLGSMQYTVTAEAIRGAMKLIPNDPTPESIELFLNEERNLKLDVEYAGRDEHGDLVNKTRVHDVETTPGNYFEARRELQALLDLRQDLLDMSEELTAGMEQGEERTLLNTLRFMETQQVIDPIAYKRAYINNKRLGLKNYGQSMADYVAQETTRAAENVARFAAKGEYAVQFLEGLDAREGDIPERLIENLAKRCVAKLITRRIKIGQSLSWRTDLEQRLEAEGDMTFIEQAIVALGGVVPEEAVVPDEVIEDVPPAAATPDMNALLAMMAKAMVEAQHEAKRQGPSLQSEYRKPGECVSLPVH